MNRQRFEKNNNVYKDFPELMNGGRFITDYTDRVTSYDQYKRGLNIIRDDDFRSYLQR